MVPGEMPPRVFRRVYQLLTLPLSSIFNQVTNTQWWPTSWKRETTIAVPKTTVPESFNDLRNISLTPLVSKIYESFVYKWTIDEIGSRISPTQFGNQKGISTAHVLSRIISEANRCLDNPNRFPVLVGYDLAKAFNRISHPKVLLNMKRMGASAALLNLFASYLHKRRMQVRIGRTLSDEFDLPGGTPQGTLLGNLIFLIASNYLTKDFPPNLERGQYVDDIFTLESVTSPSDPVTPTYLHESQAALDSLHHLATENGMVLNGKKTAVVPITGRKVAVPVVSLTSPDDGSTISTSERMKLLGITISSDGSTEEHVQATAKKARKRIWMIRHLKSAGVSQSDCLTIYNTTIRSCLEYAVEAMGPMMTMIQSNKYKGFKDWS
jgi:hypothetical protein